MTDWQILIAVIALCMIAGEIQVYQKEIAKYLAERSEKKASKKVKSESQRFYSSKAWRDLRYKVLKHYEATCMCCGASRESGHEIHVDHILPRSLYPGLALQFHNMQCLCRNCNMAKSNTDYTDWR